MTNLIENIKEDLRVLRPQSPPSLLRALLSKRQFRAVFTYRLANSARQTKGFLGTPARLITKLLHRRVCAGLCMELPPTCRIGPGLLIYHGYGLVVHESVEIGHHAILKHHTTLGTTEKGVPTLGNHVEIGVHCVVVGPVNIGDYSVIGAGSVITKDVEPQMIVVGNGSNIRKFARPSKILPVGDEP